MTPYTQTPTGVPNRGLIGPKRGTIEQIKVGWSPNPNPLKRTAGAVSSGGLWSFSLRGAAVACMGRSLSSIALGGVRV